MAIAFRWQPWNLKNDESPRWPSLREAIPQMPALCCVSIMAQEYLGLCIGTSTVPVESYPAGE